MSRCDRDPFIASSDAGAFGEGHAFEPDGVALEAAGFALRIALCARSLALAEHDGFMAVELDGRDYANGTVELGGDGVGNGHDSTAHWCFAYIGPRTFNREGTKY
jgi:hypothetical protein